MDHDVRPSGQWFVRVDHRYAGSFEPVGIGSTEPRWLERTAIIISQNAPYAAKCMISRLARILIVSETQPPSSFNSGATP